MRTKVKSILRGVLYAAVINGLFDLFELLFEKLFMYLIRRRYKDRGMQLRTCTKQSALKGGK
ncbi:MAG: hypothetical protein IKO27_05110 [Ruminococcus sp.]|nr:hypothetical protein [Ruminococcus sp.]